MSVSNVRIELLNKNIFDIWKIQMEALLIKNDMWAYVSGTRTKPEIAIAPESRIAVEKWETEDTKAKANIILCINPSELKQVKECTTSRQVWLKFQSQEIYQSKGSARKATLKASND